MCYASMESRPIDIGAFANSAGLLLSCRLRDKRWRKTSDGRLPLVGSGAGWRADTRLPTRTSPVLSVAVGSRYICAVPYRVLSAFVVTVAVWIAAAPAHAAPRPLTRGFGAEIAPAGEQILVTHRDRANLRVLAIPVTGGLGREVFSFDVPNGLYLGSVDLAASPQRAAL